jgi:hypothetical protein
LLLSILITAPHPPSLDQVQGSFDHRPCSQDRGASVVGTTRRSGNTVIQGRIAEMGEKAKSEELYGGCIDFYTVKTTE